MPRNAEAPMKYAPNAANIIQPHNATTKPTNAQDVKENTQLGIMTAPTESAQSKP